MDIATTDIKIFKLLTEVDVDQVIEHIGKKNALREDGIDKVRERYFDTFDWLLYGKGLQLKKRGRSFYLRGKEGRTVVKGPATNKKKFFFWDLDAGGVRDTLQSVSNIRALTEILEVRAVLRKFSLLNKDRKTVVRFSIIESSAKSVDKENDLPAMIGIEPIKGYEKQFEKTINLLNGFIVGEPKDTGAFFDLALAALEKTAQDYSSKFSLHLDKDINVRKAVAEISLYLVEAMERNLNGVINDIDSEFLHDFRIAVRRTRSLLSQLKKNLPDSEYRHYQNEFKWLGSITGPVRDLDVYLLMQEEFRSILPDELHQGLAEFFDDLTTQRKKRYAVMREGLTSGRYDKLLDDWKRFLSDVDCIWPGGEQSCYKVANGIIRKRFKRIVKSGGKITDESPDEDLHQLRIQGKKLRYLLEFFRSFYDQSDIDFFVKHLKKLQNNLGDFNDVSVQLAMLSQCRSELKGRNKRSISIAAAIGGLLAHLHENQQHVRKKFEKCYNDFASPDNIEKFNKVLL